MSIIKHIDFQVPDWGELQGPPISRLSYRGEVMSDSPLVYLRLNESSGSIAHDETGQHDAAVDGSLTWGVELPFVFGGAFGARSDETGGLSVSETGWLPVGSSARTIELWCKPNSATKIYRGVNYGSTGTGTRLNFSYLVDEVSVAVGNCRWGVQGLSLADEWHHFVLVFPVGATQCDAFQFYIDGQFTSASVLVGQGSTVINTNDTALMINQFEPGTPNDCSFGEVAIYGSALSAQRILEHFQAATETGIS